MSTQNGQNATGSADPVKTLDTPQASNFTKPQSDFLDYLITHGVGQLSKSLRLVHDLALYESDMPLDENEKAALLDLKVLWQEFERMECW